MPNSADLAVLIQELIRNDGSHSTIVPGLVLARSSNSTEVVRSVQQAALCLVAQGAKNVILENEIYRFDEANYLVASLDLPISAQVVKASRNRPYLSVRWDIDFGKIATLLLDSKLPAPTADGSRAIFVSAVEDSLLDAVTRLVRLLKTPQHIPVLLPLLEREVLYYLLLGQQSSMLHQMATRGTQVQRLATAIEWIKQNYTQPLRIGDLARQANMSRSGLHALFKTVTNMSPLQYQKQLRLQEARRIMLLEPLDAATAGYRVGYESPSQFSREYSRLFGAPPVQDIQHLRSAS